MVTYYVVQSFQQGNKGMLIPDQPRQARDKTHCESLATQAADAGCVVVAFARTGDPETGDWGDAVILAQHGDLPAELMEEAY